MTTQYSYQSAGIVSALAITAGESDEALASHFAAFVESRIRRDFPTWETQVLTGKGTLKAVKQPKNNQKVNWTEVSTLTMTGGEKRVIPRNTLGDVVRLDGVIRLAEKEGLRLDVVPDGESLVAKGIVKLHAEWLASRQPSATVTAPVTA